METLRNANLYQEECHLLLLLLQSHLLLLLLQNHLLLLSRHQNGLTLLLAQDIHGCIAPPNRMQHLGYLFRALHNRERHNNEYEQTAGELWCGKACRGKMEHTEYGQGMQLFRSNWQLIPHPPHPTHLPLTYPNPTGPERSARASDTPQHFGSSYFGTKHSSPRRSRLEHLPPHTRDSHFMDAYIQSKDCREFMDCREKLPRIR